MQNNILEIFKNSGVQVLEESNSADNVLNIRVIPKDIYKASELIKSNNFDLLISVTAVDHINYFECVYHFYSTNKKEKIIIKSHINRQVPDIKSISELYTTANWHEREVYDMFGIHFLKHSNLKRILLPQDWIGHPLRKDYKMEDKRLSWNER